VNVRHKKDEAHNRGERGIVAELVTVTPRTTIHFMDIFSQN
jgi:hypothetical protein